MNQSESPRDPLLKINKINTKVKEYFRQLDCCVTDMYGGRKQMDDDLTTRVDMTSYEELNSKEVDRNTPGITKISHIFPNGVSENFLTSFIGVPGSGKSTYLKQLQVFLIKHGFFPFRFGLHDMDDVINTEMTFPGFIFTIFPEMPLHDNRELLTWLSRNEKKIYFLLDGLDEFEFDQNHSVPSINLKSVATPRIWVSMLTSRKIMTYSKVVFTSRPSALPKLPLSHQPNVVYCLNGLTDASLQRVVDVYNSDFGDAIATFIDAKASRDNNFLRSPFVVSLISRVYDVTSSTGGVTPDTTLVQLYHLTYDRLRHSLHNRQGRSSASELVDFFYYQMYKLGKSVFMEADVIECELTLSQLENHSFISSSVIKSSEAINSRIMITPHYRYVMEFHIARYLVQYMAAEDYSKFVCEELFNVENMENNRLATIRRFIAAFINIGKCSEKKRKIFLLQFVNKLKNLTSQFLGEKYKNDERKFIKSLMLQNFLYTDMMEMRSELEFIKEIFTGSTSDTNMEVLICGGEGVEGIIYFLLHIDPHIKHFTISFTQHENVTETYCDDFHRLIDAISQLTRPLETLTMNNLELPYFHAKEFVRVFPKVDLMLMLNYNKENTEEKMRKIQKKIQNLLDRFRFSKFFVHLNYRDQGHVLRHSTYASMKSPDDVLSILKPSNFGGSRMTLNLLKCENTEIFNSIADFVRKNKFVFDFIISHKREIKTLCEFIAKVGIRIERLYFYLPCDVTRNYIRLFCNTINQSTKKINQIVFYNCTREIIDLEEIKVIFLKTTTNLLFNYCETFKYEDNREGEKLFIAKINSIRNQSSSDLPDCQIFFKNFQFC